MFDYKATTVARWTLARIKEPSTHAGIAIAIQAAKSHFPQYADAIDTATGVFVAIAVALAEGGKMPPTQQ